MQLVLVMFKSDGERRSFSLPKETTVIGRREDCDLRIPLGEVSRKHCRLVKEADTLRMEDLGSSNGTFHNGVRVQEAIVQPGDSIQVGPIVFVAQIDGQPDEEDIRPVQAVAASGDTSVPGAAPAAEGEPAGVDELIDFSEEQTDQIEMLEPIDGSDDQAAKQQ